MWTDRAEGRVVDDELINECRVRDVCSPILAYTCPPVIMSETSPASAGTCNA